MCLHKIQLLLIQASKQIVINLCDIISLNATVLSFEIDRQWACFRILSDRIQGGPKGHTLPYPLEKGNYWSRKRFFDYLKKNWYISTVVSSLCHSFGLIRKRKSWHKNIRCNVSHILINVSKVRFCLFSKVNVLYMRWNKDQGKIIIIKPIALL